MFLGFVLATTAIQTNQKASTAVAILIPAIALGLPIIDTLLAIGRRALRGRPLFQADREHIHHRLIAAGLTHRQAVLVLYGFCAMLGAAALILTYASSGQAALLLVVLALVAFVFLRSLGFMRLDRVSASAADRKRNRALRAAVRPIGKRLQQVRTAADFQPLIREAAQVFGATSMRLQGEVEEITTELTPPPEGDGDVESFRGQFVVPGGKGAERWLEVVWRDGRREIDRDTEIAVDILCEYFADALDGLPGRGLAKASPPSARLKPM
jgi:UDP-GlcNAc:undecaprenyl-phosphate GlcNAc-1-phosphate transferase